MNHDDRTRKDSGNGLKGTDSPTTTHSTDTPRLCTDGGREPVVGRDWIAEQLAAVPIVSWDRFTSQRLDNGNQLVTVYGWIDREDEHEDFVVVRFFPQDEAFGFTTSSAEYSEYLSQTWFGDTDDHAECRRVEDAFDIENAIELTEQASIEGVRVDE